MNRGRLILTVALFGCIGMCVVAFADDGIRGKGESGERREKYPPKKQEDCEAAKRLVERERLRKEVDKQIESCGKGEKGGKEGVQSVIHDPFDPWSTTTLNANKTANKAPEDTARKLADPQR